MSADIHDPLRETWRYDPDRFTRHWRPSVAPPKPKTRCLTPGCPCGQTPAKS